MKVQNNRGYPYELAGVVARALDGADYGQGALEDASRSSQNALDAIGEIVSLLVERGIIDLADVARLNYQLDGLERVTID